MIKSGPQISGGGACPPGPPIYGPALPLRLRLECRAVMQALELVLNVEEYEGSLSGQRKTTGASVGLLSAEEPFALRQVAIDAPPGSQTSFALKHQILRRLPKTKKGNCNPAAKLSLFSNYSYPVRDCRLDQYYTKKSTKR